MEIKRLEDDIEDYKEIISLLYIIMLLVAIFFQLFAAWMYFWHDVVEATIFLKIIMPTAFVCMFVYAFVWSYNFKITLIEREIAEIKYKNTLKQCL